MNKLENFSKKEESIRLDYWIQAFFLLPFFLDFLLLFLSTIYFFINGNTIQHSRLELLTNQLTNVFNIFFLNKFSTTNSKYAFYFVFLIVTKFVYLIVIGCIFLFVYFKRKNCYEVEKFCEKYLPECKFWVFYSTVKPAFDLFSRLVQYWSGQEGSEDFKNVLQLISAVAVFYNTFIYMRNSWSPLKKQFFSLYRNKFGHFDSGRLNFFLSRILGILVIELIVAICIQQIMQIILPSASDTKNQKEIEEGFKTGKNFLLRFIETIVLAPVIEELIYRRVLLRVPNFSNLAVFSSSMLFAVAHASVMQETIFHTFVYLSGGLFFALTYKHFKNIWSSITLHAFHNLITLIIVFSKYGFSQ